jgi:hypothetical protein
VAPIDGDSPYQEFLLARFKDWSPDEPLRPQVSSIFLIQESKSKFVKNE